MKYIAASPKRLSLVSTALINASIDSQDMTSYGDRNVRRRDPNKNDTLFRGAERPTFWSSLDLMWPYISEKIGVLFDEGSKAPPWCMIIRQSGAEVSSIDPRREREVLEPVRNRLT